MYRRFGLYKYLYPISFVIRLCQFRSFCHIRLLVCWGKITILPRPRQKRDSPFAELNSEVISGILQGFQLSTRPCTLIVMTFSWSKTTNVRNASKKGNGKSLYIDAYSGFDPSFSFYFIFLFLYLIHLSLSYVLSLLSRYLVLSVQNDRTCTFPRALTTGMDEASYRKRLPLNWEDICPTH